VGLVLIVIGLAAVVTDLPAEPSPTPAAGPLPITFGTALDPETYLVTAEKTSFRHADPFAYSVNPTMNPGVPDVYVSVLQYRAGELVILQPPSPQRLLPEPPSFGYVTTAEKMIEGFGYGWFTMRIQLAADGPVYAEGRFELIDPTVPQVDP
jgi:hypothetical protein